MTSGSGTCARELGINPGPRWTRKNPSNMHGERLGCRRNRVLNARHLPDTSHAGSLAAHKRRADRLTPGLRRPRAGHYQHAVRRGAAPRTRRHSVSAGARPPRQSRTAVPGCPAPPLRLRPPPAGWAGAQAVAAHAVRRAYSHARAGRSPDVLLRGRAGVGRSVRRHGPVTPCLPRGRSAVCGLQTGRLYLAGAGRDTLLTLLLFSAAAGAAEPLPTESVDPLSMARSRLTCAQQVSALLARSSAPSGAYSQPCICVEKGSTTQAPRPNPAGCQQCQSAQAGDALLTFC